MLHAPAGPKKSALLIAGCQPRTLIAVDILRGVSALAVVFFHSRVDLWVGFREIQSRPEHFSGIEKWLSWLSVPLSQGGYFVMLFFVISGFCIHLPYAGNVMVPRLKAYSARRFWRIAPPYWVAIALGLAVEAFLRGRAGIFGESQAKVAAWSAIMGQNYVFD